ncbi:MAG: hypothetical protein ACI9Y7_002500 [Dokdonia sp.]|jgi:hypothetical protein
MRNKQIKNKQINLEKMTISKLRQRYIQGGVEPIYKPENIDYSCSCGCGFLPDIIKY